MNRITWILALLIISTSIMADEDGLKTLKKAGNIIFSADKNYKASALWRTNLDAVKNLDVFDNDVNQILNVVCSDEQNRSVLLVGEPSTYYKFLFARASYLASKLEYCKKTSHVEINANKIIAGNSFVGDVEEYWEDNILKPSSQTDSILYFNNLGRIIGMGSHVGNSSGIESELAPNLIEGKIKVVAFMNKYEYNDFVNSEKSYVINSFSKILRLSEPNFDQLYSLLRSYSAVKYKDNWNLSKNVAKQLYTLLDYYAPNKFEPQRSIDILNLVVKDSNAQKVIVDKKMTIESAHPLDKDNEKQFDKKSWDITISEASSINLFFDELELVGSFSGNFGNIDRGIYVYDNKTGDQIDFINGKLKRHMTKSYKTNSVKLVLRYHASYYGDEATSYGFKISQVMYTKKQNINFDLDTVKLKVMEYVQLPDWMVTQNYTAIRNLKNKLLKKVVGQDKVIKKLDRLAKIGYVTGRMDDKPIGSALFVGPTGVGKSYISKKFAQYLGIKLITIDMTSFQTLNSFDRFVEIMSDNLVTSPNAIYLFEEIDKASFLVLDRLFFMLDEGVFYDMHQRPLSTKGSFILMTTNAAKDHILTNPNDPNLKEIVNKALRKKFRDSFLNRFDMVGIFKPFSNSEFHELARILSGTKISKLKGRYGWEVELSERVIDFIASNGKSEFYGARPMERLIESIMIYGTSYYLMEEGKIDFESNVKIDIVDIDNLIFSISVNGDDPVEYEADLEINNGDVEKSFLILDEDIINFMNKIRLF